MAASAEGYTLLIVNLELVEENNLARRKVFDISKFRIVRGTFVCGELITNLAERSEFIIATMFQGVEKRYSGGIGPRTASWGDKKRPARMVEN